LLAVYLDILRTTIVVAGPQFIMLGRIALFDFERVIAKAVTIQSCRLPSDAK
jgi:hypothetical protein